MLTVLYLDIWNGHEQVQQGRKKLKQAGHGEQLSIGLC